MTSRAILVYVPDKVRYLDELRCLVNSVRRYGGPATEIVCIGPESIRERVDPGLVFCPHPDRTDAYEGYRFAPILDLFASPAIDQLRGYDHVVRTDTDVFLTPAFVDYRPAAFTVGKGRYVFDIETRERLQGFAADNGLRHRGQHNLGSTWYGPTDEVIRAGRLARQLLPELLVVLRDRTKTWPTWFRGVAALYAGEIALNHLFDEVIVDAANLDYPSFSDAPTTEHAHVHCYHNPVHFAKAHFNQGKYDDIDPASLDLTRVNDFCLAMALEARAATQS